MMEQKKALYPPCEIGDTAFYVGTFIRNIPPFIEEYDVKALVWNGESWAVIDDDSNIFNVGTDEAMLDEGAALARFRELRDEYIKNGGKI